MRSPTVLVTGAGRGIGRATVDAFLDAGWRAVAGVRDVARARQDYPDHDALAIVALDVTDVRQVADGVAAALDHGGGGIDCLVNNAGYAVVGATEDVDLDEVRRMFETNLFGAAAVTQRVLPAMRAAGTGSVVNITSIGARLAHPLLGMYHATKYGMCAWAESMRLEVAPFGVRVHVVEPGMVDTEMPQSTRPTGAGIGAGGPYEDLFAQFRAGFRAWRDRTPTYARTVADAVAAAAADPSSPFRIPVGVDTVEMAAARRDLADEEFHGWLLGFLGIEWGSEAQG